MIGIRIVTPAALMFLAGLATPAANAAEAAAPRPTVALAPVQDRAGDQRAAREVESALRARIAEFARVVDAATARDLLRSRRVRDLDAETPERLRETARDLGADWLLSVIVHDAWRRGAPSLTVSARAYRGVTGELRWTGFEGASGLDSRTVLGLGEILELDRLADRLADRLLADWRASGPEAGSSPEGRGAAVAIVPFDGLTPRRSAAAAEAVTEATRTALHRLGLRQVAPGCTAEALRRQRGTGGRGVDATSRRALRLACGADLVLTGEVERYERLGAEFDPEPMVAIAARLVDADTGRILWTGAVERSGWDGQGLFRLGRVHSVGTLVKLTTMKLARRLRSTRSLRERWSEGAE